MHYKVLLSGPANSIWAVVRSGGRCPADEFLQSLAEKDYKKLLSLLERTTQAGTPRNSQKFKKLKGNIFEFKSYQDRLLCFFIPGRIIVVTHGVTKKKDRADQREIDRAEGLRKEFLASWEDREDAE